MAELPLNTPAGILVKTTCVDYPGLVAGAFFLKGCNIRCPYCYNIGLVLSEKEMKERADYEAISNDSELNSIQELFDLMEKRQGILKGIVISGGEPLINPYTPLIIQKAKALGYKVKLDTNGTLPDELQAFLDNENLRPDFIAMDLKTSPSRYGETVCPVFSKFYKNESYWEKLVKRTAKLVASLPSENREYRTVLVPSLVSKEDIPQMAEILPEDASWQFAQFLNKNCLDINYNKISPYTDKEINEIIEYAKTFIKGAELR